MTRANRTHTPLSLYLSLRMPTRAQTLNNMSDFILNAPNDIAEAKIVEMLSKYPKKYLERAMKTPGDGDEKFIKKKLYDIKEASYLEHLERDERHKFWNPPDETRFSLFPLVEGDIWEEYRKQLGGFWTSGDVTFQGDDYESVPDDIKIIIKNILGFFVVGDGEVDENLIENILPIVKNPEARCMYMQQMSMENIHATLYGLTILAYITDLEERDLLFTAAQKMESVKLLSDWVKAYIDNSMGRAENMVAFEVVENQIFQALFALIFWMRTQGYPLKGFYDSNVLISRDEALHAAATGLMYRTKIPDELKMSREDALRIVKDALKVQEAFVKETLGDRRYPGMNADLVNQYSRFIADDTLVRLGYEPEFNVSNPFPFMEHMSLEDRRDFFSGRVYEYQRQTEIGTGASMCLAEEDEEF